MAIQRLFFEISVLFRTILFLLASGIVLILTIPITIYRPLLQVVAKIWRPDLAKIVPRYHQLIAHDNFFEDKVATNIVAWQVMEGYLSVDSLRKMFMENVINFRKANGELEFPEFRQHMVSFGGYLFWKDVENFDIKNHIRSLDLDNEKKEVTESDLQRIISRVTSARWTKNQGFWDILVINNYTSSRSSGDSVMIFRIHHSLGDGYSYLHCVVRRLCQAHNRVAAIPSPPTGSTLTRFMRALAMPFKLPYDFVRLYAELNHDKNAWLVGRERLRQQYITVWSEQVELQAIKMIKRKFGVSFQAVLSSVIGGAIRRLMESEGQDVPEIMTTVMPFPKEGHPEGLSMNMYFTYIKVPVRESDPVERLRRTHSFLSKQVISAARFMMYKVYHFVGGLPHALLDNVLDSNYTFVLSCFPGIQGDISLLGHKVYEVNFTLGTYTGCGGVAITTLSCFNVLRFNITIDKGIYPSEGTVEAFSGFIREEIQSLLDAANSLDHVKEATPLIVVKLFTESDAVEIIREHGVETKIIQADFSSDLSLYHRLAKELENIEIGILGNLGLDFADTHTTWAGARHGNGSQQSLAARVSECWSRDDDDADSTPSDACSKGGGIINISSTASFRPISLFTPYSAWKKYLNYFSEGVREECGGQGITVQCLTPVCIATNMTSYSNRVGKPSLVIPDARQYVQSAVGTFGALQMGSRYLIHSVLVAIVILFVPTSLQDWIKKKVMCASGEQRQK